MRTVEAVSGPTMLVDGGLVEFDDLREQKRLTRHGSAFPRRAHPLEHQPLVRGMLVDDDEAILGLCDDVGRRNLSPRHAERMIAMASSSASTDSPGVRRGPPIASIASQKEPAPRPSSKRPPESTSSEAACLAIIDGPRRGRLATSGKKRTRSVRASRSTISAHVSR